MGALEPTLSWGHVTERAARVLVVGNGPSLRELDLSRLVKMAGVLTIAVNQVVEHFQPNVWVTVDPNARQRALMRARRPATHYYAAVPDDYGTTNPRIAAHVGPPEEGVTYLRRVLGTGPAKSMERLSEDPGVLHSGNSSWAALGVAYLMRPEKVGLLGVDGTQGAYAFGSGRPGNLSHLPRLFASAVPQLTAQGVEVLNGNWQSRVDCFPRVTQDRLLEWIVG